MYNPISVIESPNGKRLIDAERAVDVIRRTAIHRRIGIVLAHFMKGTTDRVGEPYESDASGAMCTCLSPLAGDQIRFLQNAVEKLIESSIASIALLGSGTVTGTSRKISPSFDAYGAE